MYRTALRSASRPAVAGLRAQALRSAPRRFASTSPADKSRTWKGSALRWALAGGAVYYYCTSSVFAEDTLAARRFTAAPTSFPESTETTQLPTVESVIEERKAQAAARAAAEAEAKAKAAKAAPESKSSKEETTETEGVPAAENSAAVLGSPAGLEEEADQQGAFNPETGEINWDCPCLGGMADGPCGEEFKTAFSCFVYSNEEPKGMECIDKFQGMQECFRKYPEIYGAELADSEDEEYAPTNPDEPTEQQALREEHQRVAETQQTPTEGEHTEADKQVVREEPIGAETTPAAEQTEAKAHTSAPVAASPEAKTDAPAAAEPHGSKWEDATGANDSAEPKN